MTYLHQPSSGCSRQSNHSRVATLKYRSDAGNKSNLQRREGCSYFVLWMMKLPTKAKQDHRDEGWVGFGRSGKERPPSHDHVFLHQAKASMPPKSGAARVLFPG